jgi:hypothetical protein
MVYQPEIPIAIPPKVYVIVIRIINRKQFYNYKYIQNRLLFVIKKYKFVPLLVNIKQQCDVTMYHNSITVCKNT